MATFFMTNADYLDDLDTSALVAILRDREQRRSP
jgi:hypothetical protein